MNSRRRTSLVPSRATVALSLIVLLAGSACAVRRPYTAPLAAVPTAWARHAPEKAAPATLAAWWDAFHDPLLTSLVTRAVEGNLDVRVAVSRLREARASARGARGALAPALDASASGRIAGQGAESGFEGTSQSYGVSLDASWELDVFGGIRSAADAATATAGARVADVQDVLISLAAEAALGYIDVRSLQRRLEIARANVALQEQTLELTQLRLQAGLGTDLEVQQALSNVASTRAQIASLDLQRGQAVHALSVLIGQPPDALSSELAPAGPIPTAPIAVAVGIPAETVRRRPDVRSAERQLAAQFEQVNAARADLYPSFRLAGSIGLESLSLAKLLLPGAGAWNIAPSSTTRLFNRRQLRENVVVQTERQTQAALAYESQVLTALRDVEDALIALTQEQARRDSLAAAAGAAQQAADLSLQLYTSGLRDFREVLDAQRSLLTLQDSLASSEASVSTDLVRLYKALGGGWQAAETLGVGLEAHAGPSAPGAWYSVASR
jgi:NodT family efflux transporter outer membrane factor (OMF) lipoprotein